MFDASTIALALDNADLFEPHFPGGSWTPWRAFIRALCAAPMTAEQLAIYQQHTGRTAPPADPFNEATLIVGRRGGKSRILAFVAVALATLRDYDEHLSAGEVATIGVLASTTKQARSIFNYTLGLLRDTPPLRGMVQDETQDTILLRNRVQIEIASASFRSTRGYTYAAVLADEVAFWRSEESANPDVEILRALRPGLASIPGSVMLLASSPYGKKGVLYNSYRRYYGKDDAPVLVWKADTASMNPKLNPAIIAREYEEDPEAAQAEYGAEFRDDLADFISREAIDAITCWGRHELPPVPGVSYAAFCDPSGGSSDAMTLAVAHLEGDVGVLDAVLEIRAPFSPDVAVAECVSLLRRYNVTRAVSDRYAGAWPVARFAQHGVTLEQSARGKSDLYHDFLALAMAKRVELLDHTRMAAQFVGLERRVARSGKDSIAEPPGAHDDICNAVAGVLVGLDIDRRPTLIPGAALAREGDAPEPLGPVSGVFGVLWLDVYGTAAWAAFAMRRDASLLLLDFDVAPWTPATLDQIAALLDASREQARAENARCREHGVGALMYVPAQLVGAAGGALARAFAARVPQHDRLLANTATAEEIDAAYLADPVGLAFNGSAHVNDGRLRLSAAAQARSQTVPLLGALAVRPGERVDDNPLRVAVLLGLALALDDAPSHVPVGIPGAAVVFG